MSFARVKIFCVFRNPSTSFTCSCAVLLRLSHDDATPRRVFLVFLHLSIVGHVDPLPGFLGGDAAFLVFCLDPLTQTRKMLDLFLTVEVADAGVETSGHVRAVPVQQFDFSFVPGSLLAEQARTLDRSHLERKGG